MTARRRNSALRFAIALATTAAILALGARAGRAPPGSESAAQQDAMEAYPGASSAIRLGDAVVASGQPLQVSAFRTTDSPPTVVAFYETAFRRRGMFPLSRSTPTLGHASAIDPHDGVQRFATALATSRGETLVFIGAADLRRAPRFGGAARDAPYPVPERTRSFLGSAADDGGAHADMGQFVTPVRPDAVLAFYRARLGAQGFGEDWPASGERFAAFAKADGEVVTVAVQPLGSEASAVFVVRTTRR